MTVTGDEVLLRDRLGIRIVSATKEKVVAVMPVDGNRQPAGLLAGGASCMLAESVSSLAAGLHAQELGAVALGVELNATHHRSVRNGQVTAVGRAISLGRRLATYEVTVSDDDQRRITSARVTCILIEGTAPQ
jgi:uncharacterized protein (TIGR00369 family)